MFHDHGLSSTVFPSAGYSSTGMYSTFSSFASLTSFISSSFSSFFASSSLGSSTGTSAWILLQGVRPDHPCPWCIVPSANRIVVPVDVDFLRKLRFRRWKRLSWKPRRYIWTQGSRGYRWHWFHWWHWGHWSHLYWCWWRRRWRWRLWCLVTWRRIPQVPVFEVLLWLNTSSSPSQVASFTSTHSLKIKRRKQHRSICKDYAKPTNWSTKDWTWNCSHTNSKYKHWDKDPKAQTRVESTMQDLDCMIGIEGLVKKMEAQAHGMIFQEHM